MPKDIFDWTGELTLEGEGDTFNPFSAPASFDEVPSRSYKGPDRRRRQRRQLADRRAEIRFEPGKTDRRCGMERRSGGWDTLSVL